VAEQQLPVGRYRPPFFFGYVVVAAATMIMMVAWGAYYSFGIFYKPVLIEFGWMRAQTALAFSLATALTGVMNAVSGILTDRFGPRRVLLCFGVFLGGGYLLMSSVTSLWQFYLFYGVMIGIGMGGPGVPILSTIPRWFAERRGMMSGVVMAGIGLGAVVMPSLASHMIQAYNWRTSYLTVGGIVLLVVSLGASVIRRGPLKDAEAADGTGVDTQASAFSGLKTVAATRQFWMVCAMFLCFGCCLLTTMVHLAPHATDMGLTSQEAAGLLAIIGGVSIVSKMAIGYLVDRIGSRKVFMMGFAALSLNYCLLFAASQTWMLYLFAGLFGMAYAGCVTPQATLVAELFGLHSIGAILGLAVLCLHIGGAIGPWVAGLIFDTAGSYRLAFVMLVVITIIGVTIAAFLKPLERAAAR